MIKLWFQLAPDPDVEAFMDATGIVDGTIYSAIDGLVRDLKAAGLWTKIKALWPMVGGTSTTCKYNLKDPRDLDAAYRLTFVNAPTIDADGVSWDGSTQYANNHLIPSTSGLTDMHLSYYALTLSAFQNRVNIGGRTSSVPYIELWINGGASGNITFLGIAGATGTDVITPSKPSSDNRGLYVASREGANLRLHRNGTLLGSGTPTFAALSDITTPLALAVRLSNGSPVAGTYNTMKCGLAAIGAGLTADEAVTYSGILNHFCEHLGRNTY